MQFSVCMLSMIALCTTDESTEAFTMRRLCQFGMTRLHAIDQLKDESDNEYFLRITSAAADPDAFQRLVSGADDEREDDALASSEHRNEGSTSPPKKGYVRVEEWEAEQQKIKAEMKWEERVQFDGQQHGNRINQNDILRRSLNGF